MNTTVKFITRTAVLLALTVLFQSLRRIVPMPQSVDQFITGSLVNTCLIIASVIVGIKGGVIISVLAPVIASLTGFLPFPLLIPFIALGNAVIVILVSVFYKKNLHVGLLTGAVAKFITLYVSIVYIAVPLLIPQLPEKKAGVMAAALQFKFSWPQLVTAIIGGLIALAVLPLLGNAIKFDDEVK